MRSIFDQYSVPENKLTHAMACCLAEDRRLAIDFVRWIAPSLPCGRAAIRVLEQQVPGRVVPEDEEATDGLPDAWLSSAGEDWALLIESKVAAKLGIDQIRRHLATAKRAGFGPVHLLVVTAVPLVHRLPARVVHKTWGELYSWFGRQASGSTWAWRLVDYFRVVEARWIAEGYLMAGTLTHFDGFHFDDEHPYTAREGRRLIRLMRHDLIRRKDLRSLIDPRGLGRPAITGRGDNSVWDFIRLKAAGKSLDFTHFPHLTFAIHRDHIEIALTLPNGMRPALRRRLVAPGFDQFRLVIEKVYRHLLPVLKKSETATPRMRINQRHFLTQRSKSTTDGELDFDLRTAFLAHDARVKIQPQWLNSVYDLLSHRRSNLQMQVWFKIPYADGVTDRRDVLDLMAHAWLAFRPLIDAIASNA